MPTCIVFRPSDMKIDDAALIQDCVQALHAAELFAPDRHKVSVVHTAANDVAPFGPAGKLIHADVSIYAGRDESQRARLLECMMAALRPYATPGTEITVEIRDIQPYDYASEKMP